MKLKQQNNRTKLDTDNLRERSMAVLDELVTSEGIKASSSAGWKGLYNHIFGRDSAIVAGLIFDTERRNCNSQFCKRTYPGLEILGSFQGHEDIPQIGEALGKIPHEILNEADLDPEQQRVDISLDLWQVDPHSHRHINWDSVDSTPLWVIATARYHHFTNTNYTHAYTSKVRQALEWCLRNLDEYGGLAGFTSADQQFERTAKGLRNQGWKDSDYAYTNSDGSVSPHPIKDVFVNALFWCALRYGAEILAHTDSNFADHLEDTAHNLKQRFNSTNDGFLVYDDNFELYYYAEAIDGDDNKLTSISADPGLCLWADFRGDSIIAEKYRDDVVARLLLPDMLNRQAGLRNYSLLSDVSAADNGYHRSSRTYWPFVSALVASGMEKANFKQSAKQVARSMLHGISQFDSMIELFQDDDNNNLVPWEHPDHDQESAVSQAWTAAAVYYASTLIDRR